MPGPAAALVEYGQIGRIEEQQVKRLAADRAVKEAAEADPVQARLCLLRPVFIQLHPVGIAAVALSNLPQGLAAAAARVQKICDNALREVYAPQDQRDIRRVRGVVAQPDIVHQPAHHCGVGGLIHRKSVGKRAERVIDRLIGAAHEVKAGKSGP